MPAKCNERPEVYSRIVGYFRPVTAWNDAKKQEYLERVSYSIDKVKKAWDVSTPKKVDSEAFFHDEGIETDLQSLTTDF